MYEKRIHSGFVIMCDGLLVLAYVLVAVSRMDRRMIDRHVTYAKKYSSGGDAGCHETVLYVEQSFVAVSAAKASRSNGIHGISQNHNNDLYMNIQERVIIQVFL